MTDSAATPALPRDDLSAVIKAYDVRGVVGEQIDAPLVREVGAAMACLLRDESPDTGVVVVGHDMRPSSPELSAAFAAGAADQGADVVTIGLASTDELYFASGSLDRPGAMFTASHNPAQYNGIKLCRAGARPIGQDSGLLEIRDRAEALLADLPEDRGRRVPGHPVAGVNDDPQPATGDRREAEQVLRVVL